MNTKTNLLDEARAVPGWAEHLPDLAAERGITPEQLEAALASTAAGFGPMFEITRDRYNQDTREWTEEYLGMPSDYHQLEEWADWGLMWHKTQMERAAKPAATPTRRKRRSKEALRKSKARAEGRVKPYQRKGAASLETMVAATEASLATRKARLAEIEAEARVLGPIVVKASMAKCLAGIAKVETTLATYKARLASKSLT